eukprot:UN05165
MTNSWQTDGKGRLMGADSVFTIADYHYRPMLRCKWLPRNPPMGTICNPTPIQENDKLHRRHTVGEITTDAIIC